MPLGDPGHGQDVGARENALVHVVRQATRVDRHARAFVFDQDFWKFVEQAAQARRKAFDARFGGGQVGMRSAMAVDLDLEAVQPGVIDMVGKARAGTQVIEPAAADDSERDARRAADRAQQLPAFRRQLRRRGIGIEFRERSVEVEQQDQRGAGLAPHHLGLNFRKHLAATLH